MISLFVIPAQAGIQLPSTAPADKSWIPACAGMTR